MKRYVGHTASIQALGALIALGFVGSAWGGGCDQALPGASTVLQADGTQSCSNISGQVGCSIPGGSGSCTAYLNGSELFTVTSTTSKKGGLDWDITSPTDPIKVDTALIGGGQGGNACIYVYSEEAVSGKGLGFNTGKNFQNVQYAEFCTDKENQQPPMQAEIPKCDEIMDELDGTGIDCNTLNSSEQRFIISLDPEQADFAPTECTCNVRFTPCGPNVQAEDLDQTDTCLSGYPLNAVPIHYEAFNDGTTVCRTISGRRTCWTR